MRLPPRAEEIRRAVLALALGHYGSWVLANWGFANGVLAHGVLANRRCLHNWLRTRHVRGNCGPHESQRGTSNDQEFQHRTDFLCRFTPLEIRTSMAKGQVNSVSNPPRHERFSEECCPNGTRSEEWESRGPEWGIGATYASRLAAVLTHSSNS